MLFLVAINLNSRYTGITRDACKKLFEILLVSTLAENDYTELKSKMSCISPTIEGRM